MRSTFMGLETNKRGLFTQQSGLYTTGHNISNANTLGYSRQRVNMQATAGFPGVGLNTPTMPGFLGTGVEAGSIQRIRDSFVDQQFRQESNKLGYWESRSKAIGQMEDVLAEPSAYGLQQSLSEFWSSLQTLAANPENGGARAVVVQRGEAVADSFNYIHKSLSEIQTNLGKEIGVSTKAINSILEQIADLNRQISQVEPNGYMPNDLYDARDMLLDELSTYVPIETSYEPSGGRALNIAEGTVTVTIKMKSGGNLKVVEGRDFAQLRTQNAQQDGLTPDGLFQGFYLVKVDQNGNDINLKRDMTGPVDPDDPSVRDDIGYSEFLDLGKMKSLIDSYGTADGKGLYPDMLADLDKMAQEFAKEFNEIHRDGFELNSTEPGKNFFEPSTNEQGDLDYSNMTAGNIKVNEEIKKDPGKFAASDSVEEVGNGKIAKRLADMQFNKLDELDGTSIQTFYSGVIGKLGVEGQQAERLTFNTTTLLGAVSHRRDSISSVSLDEEMTDMIKFQQAYNASARMITVVDETLDKIINGMGVVGR